MIRLPVSVSGAVLLAALILVLMLSSAYANCPTFTSPAQVSTETGLQCAINQNIKNIEILSGFNVSSNGPITIHKNVGINIYGSSKSILIKGNGINPIFQVIHSEKININTLTFSNTILTTGSLVDKSPAVAYVNNSLFSMSNILFHNNSADIGTVFAYASSFLISNSTFLNSIAISGSSIVALESKGNIYNSNFFNCVGEKGGGSAIIAFKSLNITVKGCSFYGNIASYGGAVYYNQVNHSSFINNSFIENGAVMANENGHVLCGGAIFLLSSVGITFEWNNFMFNIAAGEGAAVALSASLNVYFYNNYFGSNVAHNNGGSMSIESSKGIVISEGTLFNSSFAKSNGGSLYIINSEVTCESMRIINSTLTYFADSNGIASIGVATAGGGIYVTGSTISLTNVVISNTMGSKGAHIYAVSSYTSISKSFFTKGRGEKYVSNFENSKFGSIEDSVFEDNYCNEYGGAIVAQNVENFIVLRSNFTRNTCNSLGGAIWLNRVFSVDIAQSIFEENTALANGGAIYIDECNITLSNSTFRSNYAKYNGGAININYAANLFGEGNYFISNKGDSGGAISAIGTLIDCRNDIFSNNIVRNSGGAIMLQAEVIYSCFNCQYNSNQAVNGGAVYAQSNSFVSILNSTLRGNTAKYSGGAFYLFYSARLSLMKSLVVNSYAELGGVLSVAFESQVDVASSYLYNSSARDFGGGLYIVSNSSVAIRHSTFQNITAGQSGGMMYIDLSALEIYDSKYTLGFCPQFGAVIYALGSYITVTISIFDKNGLQNGLKNRGIIGLAALSKAVVFGSIMFLENSTLYSNHNKFKNSYSQSGGIVLQSASLGVLKNDIFSYNFASEEGACLFGYKSKSVINGSIFEHNRVFEGFGSATSMDSMVVQWTNVSFSNNVGTLGGANYFENVYGSVTDSKFMNNSLHSYIEKCNTATISAYPFCGSGAAFYLTLTVKAGISVSDSIKKYMLFSRCSFESNEAPYSGGAVVIISYKYDINITDSIFSRNKAVFDGGAIRSIESSVALHSVRFINNTAMEGGGGAYSWYFPLNSETDSEVDPIKKGKIVRNYNSTGSGNKAVYGNFAATNAIALKTITNGNIYESNVLNNNSSITVLLADFYDNTVLTSAGIHSTITVLASSSVISVRSLSSTLAVQRGAATFKQLTVTGYPGNPGNLTFQSSIQGIARVNASLMLAECQPGSVFTKINGQQAFCSYCQSGKYSFEPTNPCKTCPPHSNCPGGNLVETDKGYWRQAQEVVNPIKCNGQGCLGGYYYEGQCKEGYLGPLCSVCENGWAQNSNKNCIQCNNSKKAFSTTVLPILVMGVFIIFVLAIAFREFFVKLLKELSLKLKGFAKSFSSDMRIKLKILISFLQILVLSAGAFNLHYPTNYGNFLNLFNLFGFDFTQFLRCDFPTNFYFDLIASTLMPFLLLIIVTIILAIKIVHARRLNARHPYYNFDKLREDLIYCSLIISYFTLSPTSTHIFQIIQPCRHFPEGNFMIADYSINCDDPIHKKYLAYAYFMILVYPIGIPAVYAYNLIKYRTKINPPFRLIAKEEDKKIIAEDIVEGKKQRVRKTYTEILHIAFLYDNYKSRKWYFEIVDCMRRIGLGSIPYLLEQGSVTQIVVVLLISLGTCAALSSMRPYASDSDNTLAIIAQWSISLMILLSLALKVDTTSRDERSIGALLIFVNIVVIIGTAYSIYVSNQNTSLEDTVQVDPNQQSSSSSSDSDSGSDNGDKNYAVEQESGEATKKTKKAKKSKKDKSKNSKASLNAPEEVENSDKIISNSKIGDVESGGDKVDRIISPMHSENNSLDGAFEMKAISDSNQSQSGVKSAPSRRNRYFMKKKHNIDAEVDSDDEL